MSRVFAEASERAERPVGRLEVEADRDRMATADLAAPADQARHHAARADHEPRRNLFAAGQRQDLVFVGQRDIRHLALQERDIVRDEVAQPVHQRTVFDAVFLDRLHLGEAAEPRHPDVLVAHRRRQHFVEHPGLAQRADMRLFELLAAKIRTARVERIDQCDVTAGTAEHRRGERARKPRAHNGDLGVAHLSSPNGPARDAIG
jgi:hypothetical protein